jgi:methionyl-tRNA synthetase
MSPTQRTFFLTTPIYYLNDVPHVGHAYTTIAADALTRARRVQGHDAFLLTGTDEHGQNIERIARERGVSPQEHCDRLAAKFEELWARYDIRYDGFIRTTDEIHKRGVLKLWARLREARSPDGRDAIYRGRYAGWYCPRCEAFKDEEELVQPGNVCPDHERPCEWTEEENFFFRLSAYQGWLQERIEAGTRGEKGGLRIDPEGRRNEVLALIRQGLQDFSVSRARVKWGIPVPEQPDHVLYVWVDALSNYITALGYADDAPGFHRYWGEGAERMHLIGKEIIRFHCLYWPAILHAAGVPIPSREFVQGHITKNGKRLSKTTGNVIDPVQLVERHGPDAVRYFLLREGVYGQDWDYTDAAFRTRYNADLANDLGNLVSRVLTMVGRYCEGRVPAFLEPPPEAPQADAIFERYEALDFSGALGETWKLIGQLNQEIVVFEPWAVARDPARRAELDDFLFRHLERLRQVAVFLWPVIPRASARIFRMLGLEARDPDRSERAKSPLQPGAPLGTVEPLFPRLERSASAPRLENSAAATRGGAGLEAHVTSDQERTPPRAETTQAAPPTVEAIDIAEFARLDLRVAQIKTAEKIQGSKKLLRLEVDLGTETRQVVAGIADAYAPESLPGRKVVLVANLKPAKLMGVESNGMVLAASIDGRAVLCSFDADVAPGTRVK